MPELPEVETIRRSLAPIIVNRRIRSAELRRRDVLIVPGDPGGGFARQRGDCAARPARFTPIDLLAGCVVTDIRRRGKQLAIIAASDDGVSRALVVQLGMSGALEALDGPAPSRAIAPHLHALWELDRSAPAAPHSVIAFIDPRRFGGLRVMRSLADLDTLWKELGPDALDIDGPQLSAALHGSQRAIKAALLDQSVLAGVGNIYADEALHRAGISPRKVAARLGAARADFLAAAIRSVLAEAVEARGSTLRDYRDAAGQSGGYQGRHAVYGRGGEPCRTCGTRLRAAVLGQRTTVWCHRCQR